MRARRARPLPSAHRRFATPSFAQPSSYGAAHNDRDGARAHARKHAPSLSHSLSTSICTSISLHQYENSRTIFHASALAGHAVARMHHTYINRPNTPYSRTQSHVTATVAPLAPKGGASHRVRSDNSRVMLGPCNGARGLQPWKRSLELRNVCII